MEMKIYLTREILIGICRCQSRLVFHADKGYLLTDMRLISDGCYRS